MSNRTGALVAKGSELEWEPDDEIQQREIESQPAGSTTAVDHDDTSPVSLLAAASVARTVLVVAKVTELVGGGTEPTFDIGWTADPDGIIDQADFVSAAAGDIFHAIATVPANQAVICTVTAGATTPTGALSISALALPTV